MALPLGELFAQEEENDMPVTLTTFRHPEYGEHSGEIPEMMIYGAKAKTVGILTYLDDLKLEWFDGAIDKIKATVTTPFGIYDRSTKIIKGDKSVTFESISMKVDGVGFEADPKKKIIRVLSNVKVVLSGDLDSSDKKKSSSKVQSTNEKTTNEKEISK